MAVCVRPCRYILYSVPIDRLEVARDKCVLILNCRKQMVTFEKFGKICFYRCASK